MRGIRGLAAVVVLLGLFLVPSHAARATTQVGCQAQGYTLTVPSEFVVTDNCTSHTAVKGDSVHFAMMMFAERHGYWNDARSTSSITNDLIAWAKTYPKHSAVSVHAAPVHGQHFMVGTMFIPFDDGTTVMLTQMEGFKAGYMYKFRVVALSSSQMQTLIAEILISVRLNSR